jgi:hypothetical protein
MPVLTRNHRQEALCRAYVQAVAARAGMSLGMSFPDDGIDLSLLDIDQDDGQRWESGYRIEVQAKSVSQAVAGGPSIRYDLDVRAFNVLRTASPKAARILVVLLLPSDESQWLAQTEAEMTIRHCAYWLSLAGRASSPNRRSVRLLIPRANVFPPAAVRDMIAQLKTGGSP